jgi:hypothetical protein
MIVLVYCALCIRICANIIAFAAITEKMWSG